MSDQPGAERTLTLAEFADAVNALAGERTERDHGLVDRSQLVRFALAIGETRAVHLDAEAARAAGHPDVVACPNFLASVVDWSAGRGQPSGAPDGLPMTSAHRRLGRGLRVVGGGESMTWRSPVHAGEPLFETQEILGVETKVGRSGPLAIVSIAHTFHRGDGHVYEVNRRRHIYRDQPEVTA